MTLGYSLIVGAVIGCSVSVSMHIVDLIFSIVMDKEEAKQRRKENKK